MPALPTGWVKVTSRGDACSETQSHMEGAPVRTSHPCGVCFPWAVLIRVFCKEQPNKTDGVEAVKTLEKWKRWRLTLPSVFEKAQLFVLTGCLLWPFLLGFPAASWPQPQALFAHHRLTSPAYLRSSLTAKKWCCFQVPPQPYPHTASLSRTANWMAFRAGLFVILCCHNSISTETPLWLFPRHCCHK